MLKLRVTSTPLAAPLTMMMRMVMFVRVWAATKS